MRLFGRAARVSDAVTPAAAADPVCGSIARTHVGRVRQINEDRLLDRPERGIWAIADGMGGHRGGDVAAEIVIGALAAIADAEAPITSAGIQSALHRANRDIRGHALAAGGVIGSTVIVLHVSGGRACLSWVGDSRGYRLRAGRLSQLTRDHSLVQELLDAGAITPEAAAVHPQANVVTRALGVDPELVVETRGFSIVPGELILLCSDGLSRSLEVDAVEREGEADEALADRLLLEALHRDGSDNISLVIVRMPKTRN